MGNYISGGSTGYLLWENNKTKKGYKIFYNFLRKFNKKITFQQMISIIDNSELSNVDKLKLLKTRYAGLGRQPLGNSVDIDQQPFGSAWIEPEKNYHFKQPKDDFPVRGKVKSQWIIYNLPKNWELSDFRLDHSVYNNGKFGKVILPHIGSSIFFKIHQKNHFKLLDIGTMEGNNLSGMAKLLKLDNSSLYSCDIAPKNPESIIGTFIHNANGRLLENQVKSNLFNLITLYMVAHHFKDMDGMFSDIYRICAPGGFLLLREHQLPPHTKNTPTSKCVLYDTIHAIYSVFYDEDTPEEWLKNYDTNYANYKNESEWVKYIESFGFKHIATNIPEDYGGFYDPFYMLYQKI